MPTSKPEDRGPDHPDWFQLSKVELDRMMPRMKGIKIVHEHGNGRVGEVLEAFYNSNGDACVRIKLDDGLIGENAKLSIERGLMAGLSLTHNRHTYEPKEVSLCVQGARPGSGIYQRVHVPSGPQSAQSVPKSSDTQSPQRSDVVCSFVRASFSQVTPNMASSAAAGLAPGMPPPPAPTAAQAMHTPTATQAAALQDQLRMLAQNPALVTRTIADMQANNSAQAVQRAQQAAVTGVAPGKYFVCVRVCRNLSSTITDSCVRDNVCTQAGQPPPMAAHRSTILQTKRNTSCPPFTCKPLVRRTRCTSQPATPSPVLPSCRASTKCTTRLCKTPPPGSSSQDSPSLALVSPSWYLELVLEQVRALELALHRRHNRTQVLLGRNVAETRPSSPSPSPSPSPTTPWRATRRHSLRNARVKVNNSSRRRSRSLPATPRGPTAPQTQRPWM